LDREDFQQPIASVQRKDRFFRDSTRNLINGDHHNKLEANIALFLQLLFLWDVLLRSEVQSMDLEFPLHVDFPLGIHLIVVDH
jgi:hypothetical protein